MKREDFDQADHETFDPPSFIRLLEKKKETLKSVQAGTAPATAAQASLVSEQLEEVVKLLDMLEKYQDVQTHKLIASAQREAYNFQRKSVEILSESVLIEADYKQKIPIGMSPNQPNQEYYIQKLRNCLGEQIKFDFSRNEGLR